MPERPVAFDTTLVRITLRRVLLVAASLTLALFGWFLLDEGDAVNAQEKTIAASKVSSQQSAALLESETDVVAEVDGRPITRADLERQVAKELAELYELALRHAIDERLLAAEANKRGVAAEKLTSLSPLEREALLIGLRSDASVRILSETLSTASTP